MQQLGHGMVYPLILTRKKSNVNIKRSSNQGNRTCIAPMLCRDAKPSESRIRRIERITRILAPKIPYMFRYTFGIQSNPAKIEMGRYVHLKRGA